MQLITLPLNGHVAVDLPEQDKWAVVDLKRRMVAPFSGSFRRPRFESVSRDEEGPVLWLDLERFSLGGPLAQLLTLERVLPS